MIKSIDIRMYDNGDCTYDVNPIADNRSSITRLTVPEEELDAVIEDMKRAYTYNFGDIEFTETVVE